ncbi:MAG: TIR domain-containing protein [Pseudomonadota bacterium]
MSPSSHDIFLSYSRTDRARAEKLAAALEAEGFSVWWDRNLVGGTAFSKETEAQLTAAKAVLVLWSNASIESHWVADEATVGRDKGNLVPIAIDAVEPKIGFRQFQTIDFSKWTGEADSPAFTDLLLALRRTTGQQEPTPTPKPPQTEAASSLLITSPKLNPVILAGAGLLTIGAVAFIFLRGGEIDARPDPAAALAETGDLPPPDVQVAKSPEASLAEKSIAVLPFVTLSSDENDTYFGRGLSEEILNRLTRIPSLKVAARTSAFSFEGKDVDLRQVGQDLGVAYILEGTVRRLGDQIRISAQLVRTDDGFQAWSEQYEGPAADLFDIEREIVDQISRTLQVRLGVGIGADRASGEGVDPEAFEHYLRGKSYWGVRMREDGTRLKALESLRRATEIDPDFADAWAMIGAIGAFSIGGPLSRDRDTFTAEIDDAFARALELEPGNLTANAHAVFWKSSQKYDLKGARGHLERAIAAAPNDVVTQLATAYFNAHVGRKEVALAAFNRAAELDPLNYSALRARAEFLAVIGEFEESMAFYNKCQAEKCLSEGFIAFATLAALLSGDEREIEKWRPLNDEFEAFVSQLPPSALPHVARVAPAAFAIQLDRPDKEEKIVRVQALFDEQLITDSPGMWAPTIATVLDTDVFFDALELAYDRSDLFGASYALSPYYGTNPYPDWVLRHPRYHALWERPGLAELAAIRRENGETAGLPLPTLD